MEWLDTDLFSKRLADPKTSEPDQKALSKLSAERIAQLAEAEVSTATTKSLRFGFSAPSERGSKHD